MIPKIIIITTVIIGGCASSRQPSLSHYQWASYGPGDTAAGDLTHASMPGARVVIPKANGQTKRMKAFEKPGIDCIEVKSDPGSAIREYVCPIDKPKRKVNAVAPADKPPQSDYKAP